MTKLIIFAVYLYKNLLSSNTRNCRFEPTCSQYYIDSLNKYGLPKGTLLFVRRLLSCHPLSKKPIIDPA